MLSVFCHLWNGLNMIIDGTFNPHQDHNNCCSLWNLSVVIVCSNGFVWNLIIWNIKGKSFEFLRHTIFHFFVLFYLFCTQCECTNTSFMVCTVQWEFFPCHCWGHSRVFREFVEFFSYKTMNRDFLCIGKFQSIFTIRMQLSFILDCLLVVAVNYTIKHSL